MQSDAEHQQNNADFREFGGQLLVGDKAGSMRAGQNTGDKITDKGRNTQTVGNRAENKGQNQTYDDCRNQRRFMRHMSASPP
jgi:hypothetical protein